MIFSVSTIKDNRSNIEFFIKENRKSGIDHMFIFYEGELLFNHSEYEYVTFLSSLYYNENINNLNTRQRLNIRRVVELLYKDYKDHWIVNLDGDEVINFDKGILSNVDEDIRFIRLHTIEPVNDGQTSARNQELFKTTLNKEKLQVAELFGLIDESSNKEWLSGHIQGKYMARIRLDLGYQIHSVTRVGNARRLNSRDFNIIHYDSTSFDEFVRKFKAHSENEAGFSKTAKNIVTFFREYYDDPAFLDLAKIIYNKFFVETDIDLKKKLGLLFDLDRMENPSDLVDDIHVNVDILKNTLVIHGSHSSILKACAIALEEAHELEDAYIVYKLAQCSRPWGSFISKKVMSLATSVKELDSLHPHDDSSLTFSEEQINTLVAVKKTVDETGITDLSNKIKVIIQKYS